MLGVVNDFYMGLYLQMFQVWKSQGKTIQDSGFVIKGNILTTYNMHSLCLKVAKTEERGVLFIKVCHKINQVNPVIPSPNPSMHSQ